jgi:hypothetical protein
VITFNITKKLVDFCRHNINNLAIILELLDIQSFQAKPIKDLFITIYLFCSNHCRILIQVIDISWNKGMNWTYSSNSVRNMNKANDLE